MSEHLNALAGAARVINGQTFFKPRVVDEIVEVARATTRDAAVVFDDVPVLHHAPARGRWLPIHFGEAGD